MLCSAPVIAVDHRRKWDHLRNEALVVFDVIDSDGNGAARSSLHTSGCDASPAAGSLSMNELSTHLSDFGLTDEEVETLFFKMDSDRSGAWDLQPSCPS